jgi:regulator of sigma E protease
MIAQLILGLAFLVFVHELGHFLIARMFKIRVPKFYLFFNPAISILRCKMVNGKFRCKFFTRNLPATQPKRNEEGNVMLDEKGKPIHVPVDVDALADNDWRKYPDNTEYGIGWLPLGGYCQIAGMIDETQSVDNSPKEPQPWEYRSKPAWQRLLVVLGGVMVNLIVGVLLFALVIGKYEKEYLPNAAVTDGIYAYKAAEEVNFRSGDKIISVNGTVTERFSDAISPKMYFGAIVQVERDGKLIDIVVNDDAYNKWKGSKGRFIDASNYPAVIDSVFENTAASQAGMQKGDRILSINDSMPIPSWGKLYETIRLFPSQPIEVAILRAGDTLHRALTPDSSGLIGVASLNIPYPLQSYSLGQTFVYGWKDAMTMLTLNIKGLGKVISGKENARESLAGPIGIAQIYGGVWRWEKFWHITGLLSLVLAFMNVLPIPGLDGGHAIFACVELVTRRKVSDKVLQYAQTVGMLLLLLLMLFIIGNDIFKLFL